MEEIKKDIEFIKYVFKNNKYYSNGNKRFEIITNKNSHGFPFIYWALAMDELGIANKRGTYDHTIIDGKNNRKEKRECLYINY